MPFPNPFRSRGRQRSSPELPRSRQSNPRIPARSTSWQQTAVRPVYDDDAYGGSYHRYREPVSSYRRNDEEAAWRRRRQRDEDDDWNPCFGFCCLLLVADGRIFGVRMCCFFGGTVALLIAAWIGITRNLYCNVEALKGVEPPFQGQLLPTNFTLVERKYYFQFTKLVDVYDENLTWLGYFYDINMFVIMRFGFSDAQNRIWFEARYASVISRFKPWIEYNLQLCDTGEGHATTLFELREDWWKELIQRVQEQMCLVNCVRIFNIAERKTDAHVMEQLLPPSGFGSPPILHVRFDSTINPTISIKGVWARHAYWMRARVPHHGPVDGFAHERFFMGDVFNQFKVLARWHVWINESVRVVPNWVVGYMAVLDNIEEDG